MAIVIRSLKPDLDISNDNALQRWQVVILEFSPSLLRVSSTDVWDRPPGGLNPHIWTP